ncbi:MAG TPA: N(5)-(carboxyethyl)ornithine synthase [Candidatus Coprenecus stercoripullorum]|nr:N(5)-(carboxyethyl)ornithine synthase [Candidatus Coprenecus stercoripullorum]
MRLGFIIPTYPGEKRVALLPEDIDNFENELLLEHNFGHTMDIPDDAYKTKGCEFASRKEIFSSCDAVFCLKLIQQEDYEYLRTGQMIIGWTHPTGSGKMFYEETAKRMHLKIVDLDNIYPSIYYLDKHEIIPFIPRDFIWKNSFWAGVASVQHALVSLGYYPDSNTRVAVLANGNVSQGAYNYISKFGVDIKMFYRKTMPEFYRTIGDYDIIINGIEVDGSVKHIITKEMLADVKRGCILIDSAADAGNAIEGTHYTSIQDPVYKEDGLWFYEVNNAPSLLFRRSSIEISKSFSKHVYKADVKRFMNILQ